MNMVDGTAGQSKIGMMLVKGVFPEGLGRRTENFNRSQMMNDNQNIQSLSAQIQQF